MAWATNSRVKFKLASDSDYVTLDGASISENTDHPVLAEDGFGYEGRKIRVAGRATLATSLDVYEAFRARIMTGYETSNPLQFVVETRQDGGSGWKTIASWTASVADNKGGPRIYLGAPVCLGNYAVVVEWAIDLFAPPGTPSLYSPAVGHTWTQTFEQGADERLVRVIRGLLKVAPGTINGSLAPGSNAPAASDAVADWIGKNPIPDLYRLAIIPPPPDETWRREPGQITVGPDFLAYEVRDAQLRTVTPWPARVAEYSFRYQRGMPDLGSARLTFHCRMEANLAISTRQLAVAMFSMMKIRVNPIGTLMQHLDVEERSIGDRVELEMTVEALAYAANNMETPTGTLVIASMFGQPYSITNPTGWDTGNSALNPYGAYGRRWWADTEWMGEQIGAAMLRASPTASSMPQAQVFEITPSGDPPVADPCTIVVAPSTSDLSTIQSNFGGSFLQPFPKLADTGSGSTLAQSIIAQSKGVAEIKYRTGMVVLSTADTGGNSAALKDRHYQVQTPHVEVSERVEVTRSAQEPPKALRPCPTGALNVAEDFKAASGTSDAQGNRAWTCEFRRAYIIEDPGTDGNGWSTVAGRRQWTPPNGYFLCGYDPAYDSDSQTALASVIGTTTDTRQQITAATNPIVT